ncbi:MAG: hypothetical protein EP301_08620 [Gammaproteobacteria bacterium]|jgi:pyruvate,water dikinase|nr:MAG: hypothetical protein EP301_08620 [Gammaproteobacteria bacterium]
MLDRTPYVSLASEEELPLALVGGKTQGINRLIRAGLPVPEGFCLTTHAFEMFMQKLEFSGLRKLNDPALAMPTAGRLRQAILDAEVPEPLPSLTATGLKTTIYSKRADPDQAVPLAVRSSATAEDLPGLSFAGQQASYLNVVGLHDLLEAIKGCWASLYTERAMRYRQRAGLAHDDVAMAVVVQRMVSAEAAGVMFTANPLTGARGEIVINANYGLGETVVSGAVTPDTFTLDRESLRLTGTLLGSKSIRTQPVGTSGTDEETVPEADRYQPVLSEPVLRQLAELGIAAEAAADGEPQDLEWAFASGQCHLVQSRPITSLPPPPTEADWQPPPGVERLFRRQVVENMSEPLSPLFDELYLEEGLDIGMDQLMAELELPMTLDDFIHRPMFVTVNGFGYLRYDLRIGWRFAVILPKILYYYVVKLPGLLRSLTERWQEAGRDSYLNLIERWQPVNLDQASDEDLINGIRALAHGDAAYWGYITMMVGAAKVTEGLLAWTLNSRLVPGNHTSGEFLRGFPSRTLDGQNALAELARNLSPALRTRLLDAGSGTLASAISDNEEGRGLARALEAHLDSFGHQIFDLDFVTPTLSEHPEILLANLRSLLARDTAETMSAEALAREREALTQATLAKLGPIRRWWFRKALGWAQKYAPYREDALFYMGAAWPLLRRMARHLGERLVNSESLEQAEDVFFLRTAELAEAGRAETVIARRHHLRELAKNRRGLRESRKSLHPPSRVPADVRFKLGPLDLDRFFEIWETQRRNPSDADVLTGFAVSPGRVTAPACVIASVEDFSKMQPGHILVCPTTTPAWTPLFAEAVGLVTDIGAVLAHGSIVAREYGIPAVMGTGNGTVRISDGDLITVDGDKGSVQLPVMFPG